MFDTPQEEGPAAEVEPPADTRPETLVMLRRWKRTRSRPAASVIVLLPYVDAASSGCCAAIENGERGLVDQRYVIGHTTRVDLRDADADTALAGLVAAGYRPRVVMGGRPKQVKARGRGGRA